ncbi:hypothetical protein IT575_00770 [bacterium]|nr:hypothetical protein [bacterium]
MKILSHYTPLTALSAALLCLGLALSASCSASPAASDLSSGPLREDRLASESVVLTILPDTYVAGGMAEAIEVTERQGKGELLIDVSVRGAEKLKAVYFHMEYDKSRYGAGRLDSRFLLAPKNEVLALYLASPDKGLVEYGELIMLPQEPAADGSEKGFSGDGLLCTLHLKELAAQGQGLPRR